MAKQENTAINNLVHLAAGRRIESPKPAPWDAMPTVPTERNSASDSMQTIARPRMEEAFPTLPVPKQRAVVTDDSKTVARGVVPQRPVHAHAQPAAPQMPSVMVAAPRAAAPVYTAAPYSPGAYSAAAYSPRIGVSAFAPTELAPAPRLAPFEATTQLPSRGRHPAQRSFLVDLGYTVKEFALPISVLMALAVAAGLYLAYGKREPKRSTVATAAAAPVAAPAPAAPTSALSSAVIAADPTLAPVEHAPAPMIVPVVAPAAPTPTVVPVVAPAAPAVPVSAVDPVVADEEIEMAPAKVATSKRSARSRRARATVAPTREKVRAAKVDEAALPPNVADKTNGGPGKLVITSNKAALIYLDGRATGMTAPKKFSVPAGAHKITLLDPETRKAKTQDIEIVAGKTATIDKQFK